MASCKAQWQYKPALAEEWWNYPPAVNAMLEMTSRSGMPSCRYGIPDYCHVVDLVRNVDVSETDLAEVVEVRRQSMKSPFEESANCVAQWQFRRSCMGEWWDYPPSVNTLLETASLSGLPSCGYGTPNCRHVVDMVRNVDESEVITRKVAEVRRLSIQPRPTKVLGRDESVAYDTFLTKFDPTTKKFVNDVTHSKVLTIAFEAKPNDDQIQETAGCHNDMVAVPALVVSGAAKTKHQDALRQPSADSCLEGLRKERPQHSVDKVNYCGGRTLGLQASPAPHIDLSQAFRKSHDELVSSLTAEEVLSIGDKLYSLLFLIQSEKEAIVGKPTATDKARYLIDAVAKKGDFCIEKLLDILRQSDIHRPDLADLVYAKIHSQS